MIGDCRVCGTKHRNPCTGPFFNFHTNKSCAHVRRKSAHWLPWSCAIAQAGRESAWRGDGGFPNQFAIHELINVTEPC